MSQQNQSQTNLDSNLCISKIKMPNNEIYNIKDEYLREQIKNFLGEDLFKESEEN